jgi:FkbM family methyltransferase
VIPETEALGMVEMIADFRSARPQAGRRPEQDLIEALLQREQTILQRESVTRDRETEIARLHALVGERESVTRDRESEIVRLRALIDERESVTRDREAEIARLHALASDLTKSLDDAQGHQKAERDFRRVHEARLLAWDGARRVEPEVAFKTAGAGPGSSAKFDAAEAFAQWSLLTETFGGSSLRGGQKLIDPYILERSLHGSRYRMIIGTEEGRSWYDNLNGIEAHQAQSLGLISSGDVVLDCGCNQGFNSLVYASLVGPSGRVIAFDPFPLNVAISRFNAALSQKSNIDFIEAGLSGARGTSVVSTSEQCVVLNDPAAPDLTTIQLVPLDDYAALRPGYIKIDIEGAEVDALAGASEIIDQMPSFYIEIHPDYLPRFNRKPMDVFRYISLDKYQCFLIYPDMPALMNYAMEFELTKSCAVFLVPRDRPPLVRYYPM